MDVPEVELREIKIADRTYIGIGLARLLVLFATLALGGIGVNLWNLYKLQDVVEDHIADDRGHMTLEGKRVLDLVMDNARAIERLTWLHERDREALEHDHE